MTIRTFEDARGQTEVTTDVVVVGSGPGGAAISRILAEGGQQVFILEEGPPKPMFRPNMAHAMRYHMQENGVMTALGSAAVTIAAGRGVGGGSLINSAICWRTPDYVLDKWIDVLGGDDRFSRERMAPVFDELSDILEITQTAESIAGTNNTLIVEGARALGLEAGLLKRNAPRCVGCGVCNYGCPSGGKSSVDRNLLVMARAAGAVVQADARVDRILVEGGRAVGVVAVIRDTETREVVGELTVRAERVILAAGAVGTPRLLAESGVAERLGPAVGYGLHLHPGNAIFGLCDEPVHMWKGATQAAYYEDPELPGVLPHTLSLPPGALLLALGGTGLSAKENFKLTPYICGCLVMISDKSSGWVGANADGTAAMTYWWTDEDIDTMRKGLIRTCEVLLAGGAKKLFVPIHNVGWCDTLEEARDAILAAGIQDYKALYAAHPMATCRMGLAIEDSVIGPSGETHGLPGLYISDSSIFPTALGVNPQLTTMAMATRIGQHLLDA
jgi:choline dehydrogenase-like flavoprotein